MLERISRFYGKEAAANDKSRDATLDKEFMIWVEDILKQFDPDDENFDYRHEHDHLIYCWGSGYDAYKNGEVI